jgi:hypothetical protein
MIRAIAINAIRRQEQLIQIVQQRVHARVALPTALMLHQNPPIVTLVAVFALHALNALTISSERIARDTIHAIQHAELIARAPLASARRKIPKLGQALIALHASDARLASTLSAPGVTLRLIRAHRIAAALLAALTRVKAPRVLGARGAKRLQNAALALARTRRHLARDTAAPVALARLAILGVHRVAEMPLGALLARNARRVVATLEARAGDSVARRRIRHINVVVALARQAFATRCLRISIVTAGASLAVLPGVANGTAAVYNHKGVRVAHAL